jgi:protein phosphatase
MQMKTKFIIGNLSDVGRVRKLNEDYYGSFYGNYGSLIIVCDGMGGHKGGDIASRIAVETIKEHFASLSSDFDEKIEIRLSLQKANEALINYTSANPDFEGMGSTIVLLLLRNDQAFYAHAGDSRIYMIRNKQIHQLTKDHSLIQQLVDANIVKPEDAGSHPNKNVVVKALGQKDELDPDIGEPVVLFKGDYFLLCTDGLTGFVQNNELLNITLKRSPQEACKELVDLANERGGKDNITVQIVHAVKGKPFPVKANSKKKLNIIIIFFLIIVSLGFAYRFLLLNFFPPNIPGKSDKKSKTNNGKVIAGDKKTDQTIQGGPFTIPKFKDTLLNVKIRTGNQLNKK